MWKDIKEVPKDTEVLLCDHGFITIGKWYEGFIDQDNRRVKATKWMEFPERPMKEEHEILHIMRNDVD